MFNNLLNALQNRVKTGLNNYNENQPSVIGNLYTGNPWNKNIPSLGGAPKIVSPIQGPLFTPMPTPKLTPPPLVRKPVQTPNIKRVLGVSTAQAAGPAQPDIRQLIAQTFPEDPKTATAVFTHESQLGKYFQNLQGAPAYGVAQIYLPAHRAEIPGNTDAQKIQWLKDPRNNLKEARKVYDNAGGTFNPWESYTTGKYRQYLQ